MTKKICKNCVSWEKPTGYCSHPKHKEERCEIEKDGITSDSFACEEYGGSYSHLIFGCEFGCIHWEKISIRE